MMRRSRSSEGRTDVMRTSGGSVVSSRLNSSVHENVRRSIRSLAWRASTEADVDLLGVDARPQFRGGRPDVGGPRLVARGLSRELRVAPGVPQHARHVEDRRRDGHDREDRQPRADGALVVERPGGQIGPDHAAASRPRTSSPTSGASVSRSAGAAVMRSASVAASRGSTVTTAVPSRSWRLEPISSTSPLRGRCSGQHDAAEPRALQPIFVIHRRLMHQIGERALAVGAAAAKENQIADRAECAIEV